MRRFLRIALKIFAWLAALALIVTIAAVLTLRSDWFHNQVKQRIVAELERVTGGRAELGDWALDWRLFTVRFEALTLHGTEPAGSAPLLQARSIEVGFKIISFWKQDVDLQSVVVTEPKVKVIVAADGSNNFPQPKIARAAGGGGLQPLLDWKISKFALEHGAVFVTEKKMDLTASGQNLHALFSYDLTGPRYKGQVSIQPLEINARKLPPLNADVYLTLGIEKNRIEISSAKLDMQKSHLEASGAIEDLAAPKAAFRFTARVAVDQAASLLKIRAARRGTVVLSGSANYGGASEYTVSGRMQASGLDLAQDGIRVSGARATANVRFDPRGLTLAAIQAYALGGRFTGSAQFPKLERFVIAGKVEDFAIERALAMVAPQLPEQQKTMWSGVASGPVHVEGGLTGGSIVASATIAIAPGAGAVPLEGSLDAHYDSRSGVLSLGSSHFSTPGAQLDVSGALGEQLQVKLVSTNPDELLPAINAFSSEPVRALPVQLKNGSATFDGTVSGKLDAPQIAGSVAVTNFTYQGIAFDNFSGKLALGPSSAGLREGILKRGAAEARIAGTLGLTNWKPEPSNQVAAAVTFRGADVSEILALAGQKQVSVKGALAVQARVAGTAGAPQGSADVVVTNGVAYEEPFDRAQASVEYSAGTIRLSQAKWIAGRAQVTGSASFEPEHPTNGAPDFRNGTARFQVTSNDLAIERFHILQRERPDVKGIARTNAEGSVAIHEGKVLLTSFNGDLTAHDLFLADRAIGNVKFTGKTEGPILTVEFDTNFLNSTLVAAGQWRLVEGYPGAASAHFSQISLGTIRDWLNKPGTGGKFNFDGFAEGKFSISGAALDSTDWRGSAELSKLEVYPVQEGQPAEAGKKFAVHNQGPIVLTMTNGRLNVSNARFSGPSTDLAITGAVSLKPKTLLDLRVNGDVNLKLAQSFVEDIETAGTVAVNASIHGAPDDPQVSGQLAVKSGSLRFSEITTGLSAVNGTLLFSGTQATIQNLTGVVGGGKVTLDGLVGFAGNQLSYRVDAKAQDVRVRYPEGVSTSVNAALSLRGTTLRSTLAGAITVLHTGFTPRSDLTSMLGAASEPVRTPSAHVGPLSGMQFDIRIDTAPDISIESSLAQDVQVEGTLRLQGTPYNPVLLGRVNVTEGEINFFGTKYTITQGSVLFTNPVKLEPVLNVDLQTRVSGIDVTLAITGPINKLNLTPRSDPPMQYADVIALLATGSPPSSDPTLAARQGTPQESFTQLGANALIGQVVANPVSSRLQRFFGVSKLKIDPQLTGVESNPQARLTVEQQVNKNVTFTYITNIATTNQVIVRIEWAFNKTWSAIAVRDENGLFGLDIYYKKRVK